MERRHPVTESDLASRCPACGAPAAMGAEACPSCGEPLAVTPDDAPLPPLPDGGLAALMPAWLRDAPAAEPGERVGAARPGDASEGRAPTPPSAIARPASVDAGIDVTAPEPPPLGGAEGVAVFASVPADERATYPVAAVGDASRGFDPAAMIAADDLPAWLRAIDAAATVVHPPAPAIEPRTTLAHDGAAVPVYLPRAEPRSAAVAADAGNVGRSGAEQGATGTAIGAERTAGAATVGVAELATGSQSAAPLPPGDEGTLPPAAAEHAEPATAGSHAQAHAEAATAATATAGDGAAPDAARPDPARGTQPDGRLQEGVAAGIATLAILIVAAAILFLVWRAGAGQ